MASYAKDVNGVWRYTGQWYTPRDMEARGRAYRRAFLLHIWLTVLGTIAIGFLPAGPMMGGRAEGLNYVMLCYSMVCIFAAAAVWNSASILKNGLCLDEYDTRYVSRLPGCTAVCAACSAAAAAAGVVYTVRSGRPGELVWDLALSIFSAGVAAVNLVFFHFLKKIPWEIRDNR